MTKKEKRKWIEAIDRLIKHYIKYPYNAIPKSYGAVYSSPCPLCAVNHDCAGCLWTKFEGHVCVSSNSNFMTHTALKRLLRLYRWKARIITGK